MKTILMVFLIAISATTFAQRSQLAELDGEWYSNEWKYGYTLTNGVGIATSTNSPNFKVGDKIIFLQQTSDKTFEGTQVYIDGKFYKITVQQQASDRLFFKGEKNASWTMTRKVQTPAQLATGTTSTTKSPAAPLASASPIPTGQIKPQSNQPSVSQSTANTNSSAPNQSEWNCQKDFKDQGDDWGYTQCMKDKKQASVSLPSSNPRILVEKKPEVTNFNAEENAFELMISFAKNNATGTAIVAYIVLMFVISKIRQSMGGFNQLLGAIYFTVGLPFILVKLVLDLFFKTSEAPKNKRSKTTDRRSSYEASEDYMQAAEREETMTRRTRVELKSQEAEEEKRLKQQQRDDAKRQKADEEREKWFKQQQRDETNRRREEKEKENERLTLEVEVKSAPGFSHRWERHGWSTPKNVAADIEAARRMVTRNPKKYTGKVRATGRKFGAMYG